MKLTRAALLVPVLFVALLSASMVGSALANNKERLERAG
jgi:hypothetical protein